jgi:hypothetical protein
MTHALCPMPYAPYPMRHITMSTAAAKTCRFERRIYSSAQSLGGAIALLMMLWGCTATGFNASDLPWKTYKNSRYGFELTYPSNWTSLPAPANGDGIAFVSPQKNSVELRSWAGNRLPESNSKDPEAKTTINPNFVTAQGVSGVLVVEVGQQVSSMTLTLTHGQIKYYLQARSQSQEFQDYYRLFHYIAQQYRIPK